MNFHDQRAAASAIPCPKRPRGCAAPAGEPCTNLQTGRPLGRRPAHEARLWDAEALSPVPWPRPYLPPEEDT